MDKSIERDIKSVIKIGKWFIRTSLVINIVVWSVIIMLAYKYIYVDMILSRYNGSSYVKQTMLDNLRYAKQTEALYHNINNTLFDNNYNPRDYGVFCDDIELKLFDDLINNPISSSNYYFDEKSVVINDTKYLGNKVIKGYLNKNSNCNNVSFTVVGNEKSFKNFNRLYI